MTDTGFIAQNGADLVTIFEPLGIGSLGPATNFIIYDKYYDIDPRAKLA